MIEVLEIGISLALGDGVSKGVAAARSDLQAMETAMNAGAVSAQRLQDVAAGALGVVRGASGRKDGTADRLVESSTAAAKREEPVQARWQGQSEQKASPETRHPESPEHPTAVIPSAPASKAAPAPASVSAPQGLAVAPSSGGFNTAPAPDAPGVSDEIASSRLPPAPAAPAVTILRMEAEAPALPVSPAHASIAEWAAGPSVPRPESLLSWVHKQPDAVPPAPSVPADVANGAATEWNQAGAAFAVAAPINVQQQTPGVRSEEAAFGFAPRTASAPAGHTGEQAHMEGDVFLDGVLVGRWLSRYLAREAGRASAGPTGFDARRAPLMPGATVGM